jgi:hypothetical protein
MQGTQMVSLSRDGNKGRIAAELPPGIA